MLLGMLSHSVLLFRNQRLDDEAQVLYTLLEARGPRPTSSHAYRAFSWCPTLRKTVTIGALEDGGGLSPDCARRTGSRRSREETLGKRLRRSTHGWLNWNVLHTVTPWAQQPRRHRPSMIVTHPETSGIRSTSRRSSPRVWDFPRKSDALLKQLFLICEPRFSWTHTWQVGDMVMWDNRCTMHRREPFSPKARRIMHRTQAYNEWTPTT